MTPVMLAVQIFLGQAYPSGKVYLAPFPPQEESQSEEDYLKAFPWPKEANVLAVSGSGKPFAARFVRSLHDGRRKLDNGAFQLESAHIPALEGMTEHEGCTKALHKPRNPAYVYAGEDFFEQMADSCASNEGIGVFEGTPGKSSLMVAAWGPEAGLFDVQALKGKPRPLTRVERAEIEKQKAALAGEDCTTNPAYLDSAKAFLSAKTAGGFSILLSRYTNPGCGGHLAEIYILDVLKGGAPVKTFEMIRPKGLL